MISSPEQEANRNARTILVAAHIETGDDPRSYVEIAQSLGLLGAEKMVELTLPEG